MQKIGDTTKTADSNGEFTDGDPQQQIPCTWLMAAWLNTVQREIINVVEKGGLTLDPNDDTQLFQAIETLMGTAVGGLVKSVNTLTPDANGDVELTANDVGALPVYTNPLTVDLNTLGTPEQIGVYFQNVEANATKDNHYPINSCGTLLVTHSAYGCQQEYTDFRYGRKFVRGLANGWNGSNGPWSAWFEYYGTNNKPTAADMNALPLIGGTMLGEIGSTSANALRMMQGGYGQIIRMDANGLYFLQTNANDPNGNYNGNRSLTINNATGEVSIGTPLSLGSTNAIYKAGTFSYSDAGVNYNQTSGMVMQGVGDLVGEIYFLENIGKYAATCMRTHSGGRDGWFEFRNDGNIYSNGTNVAPVGIIEAWPSDVPPTGWLLCDGSGFNASIFPNLALIFPSGQLPDLRGAFLRGKDNGKGVDPNRGLLSIQPGQAPASAIGGGEWGNYAGRDTGHTVGTGSDNTYTYRVMQETEAQRETRPYNVAINYIVRAA